MHAGRVRPRRQQLQGRRSGASRSTLVGMLPKRRTVGLARVLGRRVLDRVHQPLRHPHQLVGQPAQPATD